MKTEYNQRKYAVAVHVQTPDNKEYLNLCFIDSSDNISAFAAAWAILKIPQGSRVSWQSNEIPKDEEENRK